MISYVLALNIAPCLAYNIAYRDDIAYDIVCDVHSIGFGAGSRLRFTEGVHIACQRTIAQAQEFATLHGNVFIQASTAPSAAAGAGGPGTPSPPLSSA